MLGAAPIAPAAHGEVHAGRHLGKGEGLGISESIERMASPDQATNGDGESLVTALLPSRAEPQPDTSRNEPAPEWEYRTELLEHGFMVFGRPATLPGEQEGGNPR